MDLRRLFVDKIFLFLEACKNNTIYDREKNFNKYYNFRGKWKNF
jgi:hypothetical protein